MLFIHGLFAFRLFCFCVASYRSNTKFELVSLRLSVIASHALYQDNNLSEVALFIIKNYITWYKIGFFFFSHYVRGRRVGSRPQAGNHVFWLAHNRTDVDIEGIKLETFRPQGERVTAKPRQLPKL